VVLGIWQWGYNAQSLGDFQKPKILEARKYIEVFQKKRSKAKINKGCN
jgi:hypothetical protein